MFCACVMSRSLGGHYGEEYCCWRNNLSFWGHLSVPALWQSMLRFQIQFGISDIRAKGNRMHCLYVKDSHKPVCVEVCVFITNLFFFFFTLFIISVSPKCIAISFFKAAFKLVLRINRNKKGFRSNKSCLGNMTFSWWQMCVLHYICTADCGSLSFKCVLDSAADLSSVPTSCGVWL